MSRELIYSDTRGIALWDYASGSEDWYYAIGAAYADMSISDAYGDGIFQFTLSTFAGFIRDCGDGYNHNGTSTCDNQTYTVVVDKNGNNELLVNADKLYNFEGSEKSG